MKIVLYVLAVLLLVLGTVSLLNGFGVLNLFTSIHHLRYELGGALLDLLGIGLIVYAARRK
jgi:hypothetical protein